MTDAETVWVPSGGSSRRKQVYHTRAPEDCEKAPSDAITRRRETLEGWGWSECAFCSGEVAEIDVEEREAKRRRSLQELIDAGAVEVPANE
jgi:hypothetical protein